MTQDQLRRSIGRAIEAAYVAVAGRDSIARQRDRSEADHLLLDLPKPPASLLTEISGLTLGVGGTAWSRTETWGVLHLNELRDDWEWSASRLIISSFITWVSAAMESYLREVAENGISTFLEDQHPALAPDVKEFRATRNCIIHSDGLVDERYISQAGIDARASIGEVLPLDWDYAFSQTATILRVAGAQ